MDLLSKSKFIMSISKWEDSISPSGIYCYRTRLSSGFRFADFEKKLCCLNLSTQSHCFLNCEKSFSLGYFKEFITHESISVSDTLKASKKGYLISILLLLIDKLTVFNPLY